MLCTVDLGEDLVDDAVARLATAAARATLLGDRVDLVEEEDARRRAARLVKVSSKARRRSRRELAHSYYYYYY